MPSLPKIEAIRPIFVIGTPVCNVDHWGSVYRLDKRVTTGSHLGKEAWAVAWAEGRAMTLEQAIA